MLHSRLGAFVAAATFFAMGSSAACAQDGAFMTLGPAAAPPPGFLALCETNPRECVDTDASARDLVEIRAWAARTRWAGVFRTAGIAVPASAPAAIDPAPVSVQAAAARSVVKVKATPRSVRAAKDRLRKAVDRPSPKLKPAVAAPTPQPAPPQTRTVPAPQLRRGPAPSLRDLETVNRRLNRAIRRGSDQDLFGQADIWVAPTGSRPRGDCEDYVLAKRRTLIDAGVDPSRLSIALVQTRRGEGHAVLLVATEAGEFVLDNLSPWVLRWDQAPYEWRERQAPGRPLSWVAAG
ncbi:MAG: transglutaminase-like cysteine peptidase [Alphaproteobacteria bacterium]|nr:transglutaminase-like cysteine peptidase [Alphaproteobacteria bacterium]MBU2380704.1 transglutaminase-like cysteine peptidase [Alphaproteobacteria bacterium]